MRVMALLWVVLLTAGGSAAEPDGTAEQLLRAAGRRAGLCVHVTAGSGKEDLTVGLARDGRLLVQRLCVDRGAVRAVRRAVREAGLYGQVSVDHADASRLPYADDLVNLVLVGDARRLREAGLSAKEILRVLCPGGVALLGGPAPNGNAAKSDGVVLAGGGRWSVLRKPRPARMDDWTHRTYDASGNCVSRDTAVGPLGSLRWIAGPCWPMGTGYQVSNGGLLSAGGRVFGVTLNDVTNIPHTPQKRNHRWLLTARDAYSGLLLWRRTIGRPMRRDGQEFGNLVVASLNRVYAVFGGELVALDAATGRTAQTLLKDASGSGRLLHVPPMLLLAGPKAIHAIDAATGKLRWRREAAVRDVVAADGKVFCAVDAHSRLVCLDAADGVQHWQADLSGFKGRKKQLLFAAGGVAVFVWERNWQKGENGIAAFSAADGKRLWTHEYASSRATWADCVWFVGGSIWRRDGRSGLVALSPADGQPTRRLTLKGGYCGGCVRNIATTRYLISTRPPNLFAWSDGSMRPFRGSRHGCRAGVIVANGLYYSQPHGCKCVRESLRGFVAFGAAGEPAPKAGPLLERGGAAAPSPGPDEASATDWPAFRHDAERTGGTSCELPAELTLIWEAGLADQRLPPGLLADEWRASPLGGDRLTGPTVAGGVVCAALPHAHRIVALDVATGRARWSFTAGGRIDTPPALHAGLCLFGSYDGWVYCLRADDGRLVWRLRAAPGERRVVAFGQLESPWPVIGGVLVDGGIAYFVSGRSSATDGGLRLTAVEPAGGKLLWSQPIAAACSDLLVMEDGALRLAGGGSASLRFDPKTGRAMRKIASAGFRWNYAGKIRTLWGGPNRVLDRSWRVLSVNDTASHWMRIKQGYGPHEGHLLAASADRKRIFAFKFRYVHWSKVKEEASEFGGELVAWEGGKEAWKVDVPDDFQVEALLPAGKVLVAAGPTDRFRRTGGGRLWLLAAADGRKIRDVRLSARPAAAGLAVAGGRLFLAAADGVLRCYGDRSGDAR